MLNIEDIKIVAEAMYKDELRLISQAIVENQSTLNELEMQKLFLVRQNKDSFMKRLKNFFAKHKDYHVLGISQLITSIDIRILSCKKEIEMLQAKSNEIYNIYSHILGQINTDDLLYLENLILMRAIKVSKNYD
jgi:hypothetical protein